jgi:uncharacterized protein (DUF1330 family)
MSAAKGYWIGHVTVTNPERYPEYQAANAEAFQKYGAQFIVRGGQSKTTEGQLRERHVVIEFDSYQKALDCYYSPEYQAAADLRKEFGEADIIVVEGVAAS